MKKYTLKSHETSRFIDRSEIRDLVMYEIQHKMQQENYFKVISIYGIGGIGKSCLINELKNNINELPRKYKILHISFEVENNRQYVENLIRICDTYDKPCISFAYAVMLYWERTSVLQLDTKFMKKISSTFLTDLIDFFSETLGGNLPFVSEIIPNIPSISNILECTGKILNEVKKIPYYQQLKELDKYSSKELLEALPILLGQDIFYNEYSKKTKNPIIFLFDSYLQSIPYSESVEWLLNLIGAIHKGLFIITSREKLLWQDDEHDIFPYELKSYPEYETKEYLKEYISDPELIDMIITSTQCVPIYVELALSVYQSELSCQSSDLVNKALFTDREKLAVTFINHLKPEWQEVLMNLAVVRIFNKNIFEHIVKSQNLNCPIYDYEEIVQVSLLQYIEDLNSLVKIHDVFCKNVCKVLSAQRKIDILHSYLTYIISREAYRQDINQVSILLTLFINILHIEIELSSKIVLPTIIIEETLDLFFMLLNIKAAFTPIEPIGNNSNVNDMLNLMNAIFSKKSSTPKAINYLNEIKNPSDLGRHKKSYDIFKKYTFSLTGEYYSLKESLLEYKDSLTSKEALYWYYSQIELYAIDFLNMEGNFMKSHNIIMNFEQRLDDSIFSFDNFYQLQRYKGHLFRFNLFLDKAFNEYSRVLENPMCSLEMKAYIYTNLIESKCYFDYKYIDENFDKALSYAEMDKQIKNIGKLYYSRAITNICRKNYEQAEKDINKSLLLNQKDGYQSGELFAYMAQAFLEFGKWGVITPNTFQHIDDMLEANKVYAFFQLPLAMMCNQMAKIEKCHYDFKWIDFDYTYRTYQKFFSILSNEVSQ